MQIWQQESDSIRYRRKSRLRAQKPSLKKHFKRIQELLAPPKEIVKKEPKAKAARALKKSKKEPAKRPAKKRLKRGDIFGSVVETIKESGEGLTVDVLKKKTGFTQQQIRSVIFRAEKQGVIQRSKRGVYTGAESERTRAGSDS